MTPSNDNLLHFPTGRPVTMRHVTLVTLAGAPWATAGFLPGDPGAPWAWICELVAREFECREEDVHAMETDDGDVVTAEGIPVCMVRL